MLSITTFAAGSSAADIRAYVEAGALPGDGPGVRDDYYLEGGISEGRWLGSGAAALGIDAYDSAAFAAVLEARDPHTGEPLRQIRHARHRPGYDLTFSAPKSVSAAWALATRAQRQHIAEAHNRAVVAAMEHIERYVTFTRRGSSSQRTIQTEPAELVAAAFRHGTSREGDPQLHSHVVVANVARRPDGSCGALESREIYRHKLAAGAIYRAQLAEELRSLGYCIEADGDSMRIAGSSAELERRWSTRRVQIEAALQERGIDPGNARASEVAALDSRRHKKNEPAGEIHARWRAQAAELDIEPQTYAERLLDSASAGAQPPTDADVLSRLVEKDSVVSAHELWRVVAVAEQHAGRGLQSISERVNRLRANPELLTLRDAATGEERFTTREMWRLEREMVARGVCLTRSTGHEVAQLSVRNACSRFSHERGFALSDEQRAAVEHITGPGSLALVRGAAGAGKSTLLAVARAAWQDAGLRVRGAALAGKAAAGLSEGSGIESQTLHALLRDLELDGETGVARQPLSARDVVVLDEAGMVGSRQLAELMRHVEASGAKLVLVGDEKQLQPIAAGGAFRAMQERIGCAELAEIRRQTDSVLRSAVRDFEEGNAADALRQLIERDAVQVAADYQAAVDLAIERWHGHSLDSPGEGVLMLANTRAQVRDLNTAARSWMKTQGHLGATATITARDREGRSLGEREVAEGDRLLARRNSLSLGLHNGDLTTVERVYIDSAGQRRIRLRVDRTGEKVAIDPEQYGQLDYGYAVTTYAAQGVTVERAVVLAGGSMQTREATYVQMSRMRERVDVVITRSQFEEMAAHVESAPTSRMLAYAQDVARRCGVALSAEAQADFQSCRLWLNEQAETAAVSADAILRDIRDVVEAMSRSRAKGTTLDYAAGAGSEKEQIPTTHLEEEMEL